MISDNVIIGENTIIKEPVEIGYGTVIGNGVVIYEGSKIGENVRIDDYAIIGKAQMRAKNSATTRDCEYPPAIIGDGCMIGSFGIIYRGAIIGNDVLIADMACVREESTVGDRSIIGRGAYVENASSIGVSCKIQSGAYICAYTKIAENCFIAPYVVTSNDNYLGKGERRLKEFGGPIIQAGARIGAGAVILPHKTVESNSIVAAGAVLTKNTEEFGVYAGNPAKWLKTALE